MSIGFDSTSGDVSKRLLDLANNADKKIFRQSVRAAAKELQKKIIANAPVKSGKLKNSTKVRAGKRSRVKTSYEVTLDTSYAGSVEFGHNHKPRDSKGRFRKLDVTEALSKTKAQGSHWGKHTVDDSADAVLGVLNTTAAEKLAEAAEGGGTDNGD